MRKIFYIFCALIVLQLPLLGQVILKPIKLPETINKKGYKLISFVLSPDCSTLLFVQTKDYKDYSLFMSERQNGIWVEPKEINTFDNYGRKATHKSLQNFIALTRFDGTYLDFFKPLDASSKDFSDLEYVRYRSAYDGEKFSIPNIIAHEKKEALWNYEGNSQYKSFSIKGADIKNQQVFEIYSDEQGEWMSRELPSETVGYGIQAAIPVGENGIAYKHVREDGKKWETEIFLSLREKNSWSIPVQFLLEGFEKDETIYFNAYDEIHGEVFMDIDDQICTASLPYSVMQHINTIYPSREILAEKEESKPSELPPITSKPRYYALMIAINDYQYNTGNLADLDKPIEDAKALTELLSSDYHFERSDIFLLENPTRNEIINSFEEIAEKISEKDNLLIFYAGHGILDDKLNIGYWLSADASTDSKANWISNSTVRDYISGLNTKHTLLISDACFSGSIFKTREVTRSIDDFGFYRLNKLPSRKAMTSGALNSVPDDSKFMKYLLKALATNQKEYLQSKHLFHEIEVAIINNTDNVPQFGTIQNAGDEGGDFIFIKKKKE